MTCRRVGGVCPTGGYKFWFNLRWSSVTWRLRSWACFVCSMSCSNNNACQNMEAFELIAYRVVATWYVSGDGYTTNIEPTVCIIWLSLRQLCSCVLLGVYWLFKFSGLFVLISLPGLIIQLLAAPVGFCWFLLRLTAGRVRMAHISVGET